jgi:hypothetical protein
VDDIVDVKVAGGTVRLRGWRIEKAGPHHVDCTVLHHVAVVSAPAPGMSPSSYFVWCEVVGRPPRGTLGICFDLPRD